MRLTRLILAGALGAAFASPVIAPASTDAASLNGCQRLVLSPDYSRDHTALCAGLDLTSFAYRLYVSHDRAHSWTTAAATGLPDGRTAMLTDFLVSSEFAHDRMLVLSFASGVYYSTDAGSSFQLAPLVTGPVTLVPAAPAIPGAPDLASALGAHSAIVSVGHRPEPGASGSMVFDPVVPNVRAVAGTDGIDRMFVLSPYYAHDQKAFAVGATGNTPDTTVEALYSCDVAFTCRTKLFAFPAAESVDRIWFAADYATSRMLFATTLNVYTDRPTMYVSTNDGLTFSPIPTLQAAIGDVYRSRASASVVFAPGHTGSHTVFVRVSAGVSVSNPPSERLYRSDDNGRRWMLVAYGRQPGVSGARGSMPYAYAYSASASIPTPTGLLTYGPDDRMLMTGIWWGHGRTAWCSPNGGRNWTPRCS